MSSFIINVMPWIWVGLLVVMIVIEACTMGLTTIWAAAACIPMVFVTRTGLALQWQFLIFIFITAILVFFTRPFAVKYLKIGDESRGNINSLDGQTVLCIKKVSEFEFGEVKTKNGVVWTAKLEEGQTEIAEKETCTVSRVEGNTLVVKIKGE